MHALYKLTLTEIKLYLREPPAVFFVLVFPVMILLLFGTIFGQYPVPGRPGLQGIDLQAPAYTGMVIGTTGLIGLPATLAAYRERGILRRLRATPLHPSRILSAQVIVNLLMTLLGMTLLLVAAKLVFDLKLPEAPVPLAVAFVLSTLSFCAVGFVLAGLLPTVRVAQAVGQAVYFPMLFLSGAVIPVPQLPRWLQDVSDFLPLTYVVELVQGLWLGEGWNWFAAAMLAATLAASVLVSAKTFRWE